MKTDFLPNALEGFGGIKTMVGALSLVLGVVHIPAQFLTDDTYLELRHSSHMKVVPNTVVSRILLLGFPEDISKRMMGW